MTSVFQSDEKSGTPSSALTPAGLQALRQLKQRRWAVGLLNAATYLGLMIWLAAVLGVQGWSWIDVALFLCFALAALGVCWDFGMLSWVFGCCRAVKMPLLWPRPMRSLYRSKSPCIRQQLF